TERTPLVDSSSALDVAAEVRLHWDELNAELESSSMATRRPKPPAEPRVFHDGMALGRRRAAALDGLLRKLFMRAVATTGMAEPIALAAVGSFGRGAVALRSDADVRLVVCGDTKSHEAAGRVADALLYPLWDAGLSVGHQVTSASEALELAQTDLATATSLLDLRVIAGDGGLVDELVDRAYLGLFSEGELGRFVERLEEEAA